MLVRDDDIPTFVADGVCEFGVVGRNVLEESRLEDGMAPVEVVAPLGFGRCALRIAAPEAVAYDGPRSLDGERIATSYPRLLQGFLDRNGIKADHRQDERRRRACAAAADRPLHLRPRLDRRDARGERPAGRSKPCSKAEAVLIRTPRPLSTEKADLAEQMMSRIDGVLATQESKYIMLNAPEAALDRISALLPGADAPTILPLPAGRAISRSTRSARNRCSGRRCRSSRAPAPRRSWSSRSKR